MLLIEHAASSGATNTDIEVALRWAAQIPKFALKTEPVTNTHSFDLVFDGYRPQAKL
jgi:hypothetical protein